MERLRRISKMAAMISIFGKPYRLRSSHWVSRKIKKGNLLAIYYPNVCAGTMVSGGIAQGGKLEAGVGIEPAYTALQAAA
jgi:hypothetical protein